MSRFLHGCIIRRFEVTKIGKRNQLYLLDNNELEFVYKELNEVLDLKVFDIIKSHNGIQGILKDNLIDSNFKSLVKEVNSICDLEGQGFLYEDDDKSIDKAVFMDELIYGNMCSFISDKLEKEGYHIQFYVSFFLMDNCFVGDNENSIIPKLLTGLARKAIVNKLSSALIFAVN